MRLCKNRGATCDCVHHQKLKEQGYKLARDKAQTQADATGFDHGLEWLGGYGGWHIFMLPRKENRYGYEARVEVVSCMILAKCQPGHGPC
jgi:hypothetical protein